MTNVKEALQYAYNNYLIDNHTDFVYSEEHKVALIADITCLNNTGTVLVIKITEQGTFRTIKHFNLADPFRNIPVAFINCIDQYVTTFIPQEGVQFGKKITIIDAEHVGISSNLGSYIFKI